MKNLLAQPWFCELLALAAVSVAFFVIRLVLLRKEKRPHVLNDFLTGDDGKYSLSKFQAVLWALIILTAQVSAVFILAGMGRAYLFELVFSESSLWLLALSLGSYVAVRGMTASAQPAAVVSKPHRSDLVLGADGKLDFSRFQMLLWTILAVFVFGAANHNFLSKLQGSEKQAIQYTQQAHLTTTPQQREGLVEQFIASHFATKDEVQAMNDANAKTSGPAFPLEESIPGIGMSFIVLMGLSQGTYIGKKLLPQAPGNTTPIDPNADPNVVQQQQTQQLIEKAFPDRNVVGAGV